VTRTSPLLHVERVDANTKHEHLRGMRGSSKAHHPASVDRVGVGLALNSVPG
jgi:hypothetical protein